MHNHGYDRVMLVKRKSVLTLILLYIQFQQFSSW